MSAPGKSEFWTKTFHAALTGLCASGRETSAIDTACKIADTTERELTEQERERQANRREARAEDLREKTARVLAQKYYLNALHGREVYQVDEIRVVGDRAHVFFTNESHVDLDSIADGEGWGPCEAPSAEAPSE